MENMAKEKEYLFKKSGVINPMKTMEVVRNHTIRMVEKQGQHMSYTDYWKSVPRTLIDKVRFYYRYELFLYGYPDTHFYIDKQTLET